MPEGGRKARVLVVDDEPAITGALAKRLRREGFECMTAGSGEEALELAGSNELDVVITDVRMPGISGLDVLKEVKGRDSDIQVIMMTAYTDIGFAVEALRHKADDYLLKPFNMAELTHCVERSLEHRRLLLANRAYLEAMRGGSAEETGEVEQQCRQAIAALAAAIEARDAYTKGHLHEVSRYAVAAAAEMGLGGESRRQLWLGAVLHDVGMLVVPEDVLNKKGPLTAEEWRLVREHPSVGGAIVGAIPYLRPAQRIVLEHHERCDGSGYPAGLNGDEISPEARIIAVADSFAAMRSERPHRPALAEPEALSEIEANAGSRLDEDAVRAFLAAHGKNFPLDGFEPEILDLPSRG